MEVGGVVSQPGVEWLALGVFMIVGIAIFFKCLKAIFKTLFLICLLTGLVLIAGYWNAQRHAEATYDSGSSEMSGGGLK